MPIRKSTIAFLLLALLPTLSCTRLVVWYSKEKVTWSFIQEKCTVIKIGTIETTANHLSIPIDLHDKFDSAICMYDATAHVSGQRIEISVKKGLCGGGAYVPLVARVSKPNSGDYQIVYSDPIAGYPIIGSFHVD